LKAPNDSVDQQTRVTIRKTNSEIAIVAAHLGRVA
jgi:hypothetical protein